jgi:hypothetical protein
MGCAKKIKNERRFSYQMAYETGGNEFDIPVLMIRNESEEMMHRVTRAGGESDGIQNEAYKVICSNISGNKISTEKIFPVLLKSNSPRYMRSPSPVKEYVRELGCT